MKASKGLVAVLIVSGTIIAGLMFMWGTLPTHTNAVVPPKLAAPDSGSVWWVGAESKDSSALPNTGVKGTFEVISLQVTDCLSYWVADGLSNNYWGQVGYYICSGSSPVGFYQVWNLGTNTVITTGTTTVGTGTHTFSMYLQTGTTWAYAIDGNVFGTYNMGSSVSSSTYPVESLSEEQGSAVFSIPAVTFSDAMSVMKSGSWSPVQSATSYGTGWGVQGQAQNPALPADEIIVGGSIGLLSQGTQLWGGSGTSTTTSSTTSLPPVTTVTTTTVTVTKTAPTTTNTVTSTATTSKTVTDTSTVTSTQTKPASSVTQTVTTTATPPTTTVTKTSTSTTTSTVTQTSATSLTWTTTATVTQTSTHTITQVLTTTSTQTSTGQTTTTVTSTGPGTTTTQTVTSTSTQFGSSASTTTAYMTSTVTVTSTLTLNSGSTTPIDVPGPTTTVTSTLAGGTTTITHTVTSTQNQYSSGTTTVTTTVCVGRGSGTPVACPSSGSGGSVGPALSLPLVGFASALSATGISVVLIVRRVRMTKS